MDLVAWVLALAGMVIGLAAQAVGYHRGFAPTTFRAAQLGLALIAPLALAWGMAEVAARGLVMRFAARLCLCGLFVVAAVILATDVLSDQAFGQAWPLARAHYQFLPLGLLAVVAVVVVLAVVCSLAAAGLRARQRSRLAAGAARAGRGGRGRAGHPGTAGQPAGELGLCRPVAGRGGGRLAGRRPGGPGPAGRAARPGRRRLAAAAAGRTGPGTGSGYAGDDSMDLYRDSYGYGDSGAYPAYQGDRYGYDSAGFAAPGFDSQEFPAQR